MNPIGCLIAVLVIAAIAAAIYFFVIRDDGGSEPTPSVSVVPTETTTPSLTPTPA
ncbi:hypothetical protein BH18ACT17_BH18ACT17_07370 [soil metagenome]